MPYYMNFEVGAKSTQTLVAKMLMFLRVFPFWDVTMMKSLMWNNQDIRQYPLVLTIIAIIRVWVLFDIVDFKSLIFKNIFNVTATSFAFSKPGYV
jgi:hypothetical protein